MSDRAKLLLKVNDVMNSVAYYSEFMSWILVDGDSANGYALMEVIPGFRVVLTGEEEPESATGRLELARWLHEIVHRPAPGDPFYVGVDSVEAVRLLIETRGLTDYQIIEDSGTIRKLLVPVIDGYTVVYWEELSLTGEEIIALYANGPQQLRAALHGLSEEQLNLTWEPGKWTIRQNVLHLIDLEMVAIHKLKFALAEPGKAFIGTPFTQEAWSTGLAYDSRPISLEVEMFGLLRGHVLGMCRSLPEAYKRYVVLSSGKEETVERLLKMMAGHANHHIQVIRRIREAHQK